MLIYDNRRRFRLLLQLPGSIYNRIARPGLGVFLYSCSILFWKRLYPESLAELDHPFAVQTFGTLVAFAITFRANIAWNRHWEACNELTSMYTKWADAYSLIKGFIDITLADLDATGPDLEETGSHKLRQTHQRKTRKPGKQEQLEIRRFLEHSKFEFTHYFSLLSACVAERLCNGDIRRIKARNEKGADWKDLIAPREAFRNYEVRSASFVPMRVVEIDDKGMPIEEALDEDKSDTEKGTGEYKRVTVVSSKIRKKDLELRPTHRNGSTRSEDDLSVENLEQVDLRMARKSHILKGELDHSLDDDKTPVTVIGGCSPLEIEMIRSREHRVELVTMWISHQVSWIESKCITGSPIISRVYQELSDGNCGYHQAEKLADVPFPFIFAQLLALTIMFVAFAAPPVITILMGSEASLITPIVATAAVVAFWSLNEIAKELENPFELDLNDIATVDMHERFVDFLMNCHGKTHPKDRPRRYEDLHREDRHRSRDSFHSSVSRQESCYSNNEVQ